MLPCKPLISCVRTAALALALSAAGAVWADEYSDASALVRAGQFTQAQTKVDAFLAGKPSDPQMRFLKGVILRNLGKTAEALAVFTKLTEDYPELPEPYNNLAVLHAAQGQFDKARAALEMAIRTNPSYATAHENLGDVYARMASLAYNKALQLDHNNTAVAPKLALIRDLFKPNLSNAKPGTAPSAAATPSAAGPAQHPAPAQSQASASPAAAAHPAGPAPQAAAPAPTPKPAPAPAPKPAAQTSTPSSAPAAPAAVPAASDAAAVAQAVAAWAQAWSAKDVEAYLAAYSPQFDPQGAQNLDAWKQDRRARIVGKSSIRVGVSDLQVKVSGDQASARFRQTYKADRLNVSSRKTLDLQRSAGGWLIVREATGH